MKLLLALVASLVIVNTAQAQRAFSQAELDAMLAPIALQPDAVVSDVLVAANYPDEVGAAARWARANPHLRGDDAVRAVHYEPWHPAVKSLVAFPELLQRMDESPQWLHDLGEAFRLQEPHVMATVHALRRRAQSSGHLASGEYQTVYDYGETIVVQPRTRYVYVRYYDPYVVYGPWWWPHYRPVFWRPWVPRAVIVSHIHHSKPHWHQHPVHQHQVHKHHVQQQVIVKPHVRVPESQRKPIVSPMPAAVGFSHSRGHHEVGQHRDVREHKRGHPQFRQHPRHRG
jgi:hypothetical protein